MLSSFHFIFNLRLYTKDPAKHVYMVVSGAIACRFAHPDYGEYVQQVGPRSVFGESAAFSNSDENSGPFYGPSPFTNKVGPGGYFWPTQWKSRTLGPGRFCSPLHLTYCELSFLDSNGIL
jgi:hypothetical protein